MDYFEWNLLNNDNFGKKGTVFDYLKKAALVCMLIAAVLILIQIPWTSGGITSGNGETALSGGMQVFFNILIILSIELPILGCYFVFRRLASKYYDYDYFIIGDTLKIVKIINKTSRKNILELYLCDIEKIAKYDQNDFQCQKQDLSECKSFVVNADNANIMYMICNLNGEKKAYILEYNHDFITALRKAMKRESVFDIKLLQDAASGNGETK